MSGHSRVRLFSERLYPASVRRRLGPDLGALLEARWRVARGGGVSGLIRYWLWVVGDVLRAWTAGRGDTGKRLSIHRRGTERWADTLRDVRIAWRGLIRRPVFMLTVLATLGLTIGAATTIYSVVDWVLLRSLPYPDSDRLVNLGMRWDEADAYSLAGVSTPNLTDWRAGLKTIDPIAGATWQDQVLLGDGSPATLRGAAVTDGFFEALSVMPATGRGFGPADHELGAARVGILPWGVWQDRFGGDPDILGKSLRFRDGPLTVVGVMPRGFRGPETLGLGNIEVWTPFAMDDPDFSDRGRRPFVLIGRLAAGADLAIARTELTRLTATLAEAYPEANRTREGDPWLGGVVALESRAANAVGRPLLLLLGSVGLLLLIGCVNVANLMLARGTDRSRETAVRLAIGAGRGGVIRHILVESTMLAVLGGALGVALAWIGLGAFRGLAPATLPRLADVMIDGRILGVALVASLVTGLAFGLLPAIRLAALDPAAGLRRVSRGSTAGPRSAGARSWLVVLETSLALVLLVAAGLLFNSLVRLRSVDAGFDPAGVLHARIGPGQAVGPDEQAEFYDRVVDRVVGSAGITAAAFALNSPLESPYWRPAIMVETSASEWAGGADAGSLTPGYFQVLGAPILAGRDFTAMDGPEAPRVAIVNRSFADRAWPDEEPIGRRIRFSADPESAEPWRTVVGVAGDIRQTALDVAPEPMVYVPFAQEPWPPSLVLLLRAGPDRAAAAAVVRDAVSTLDPSVAVPDLMSMTQHISVLTRPARLLAVLMAVFGVLGTTLAAVGLYGTMAYAVRVRRREFGIRLALGAPAGSIAGSELRRGAMVILAGVSLGLAGAAAASRILEGFLFEVRPLDPMTIALVTAVLAVTGLAAAAGPAIAAARTPPIDTLGAD